MLLAADASVAAERGNSQRAARLMTGAVQLAQRQGAMGVAGHLARLEL